MDNLEDKRTPDNSDEFIWWLFKERCLNDFRPGTEINEIIPRSSGKDAMYWKNRVVICNTCHRKYHDKGTSEESIKKMQEQREKYLIAIGREEYV